MHSLHFQNYLSKQKIKIVLYFHDAKNVIRDDLQHFKHFISYMVGHLSLTIKKHQFSVSDLSPND